jgi:hypothetical protein
VSGGFGPPGGGGYGGPPGGGGYGPPPGGGGYGPPPGGGGYGPPAGGGGYGGPPPGGAPPGGYGGPPGGYGGPPGGGYGAPPGGGYGGPPGGYGGQPPGGYGAPGMQAGFGGVKGGFGGPMGGGVEFGPSENAVLDGAALWSKVLGVVYFVQSAGQLINLNIIAAPITFFMGLGYWKGGTSLKHVTQTQGNDVQHLMTALDQFGTTFMIRIVCTIILIVFVAILLAIGVIAAIASNM